MNPHLTQREVDMVPGLLERGFTGDELVNEIMSLRTNHLCALCAQPLANNNFVCDACHRLSVEMTAETIQSDTCPECKGMKPIGQFFCDRCDMEEYA